MELKKRLGRKEIIVPDGFAEAGAPRAKAQAPLVLALARAYAWQEMIESGRYDSVGELSAALGADRCYVRRIVTLATLAPDIVASILRGEEPSGLSLERLGKGFPADWEGQRKALACPPVRGEAAS